MHYVQQHIIPDLKHKLSVNGDVKGEQDRQVLATIENHNDEFPILVQFLPLDSCTESKVDWNSERAWFDDIISIRRRRALQDGWAWTGATENVQSNADSDDELSNSYYGGDLADWDDRQQEREATLTISRLPILTELDLNKPIPSIREIIED